MAKKRITIAMTHQGTTMMRRYMQSKYVYSLFRCGAKVRLVKWDDSEEAIRQLVSECDGVLMPGGADIDPSYYGQEKQPYCQNPIPERDRVEMVMLKAALEMGKPILGVCRGFQLINSYYGGTLYQDIHKEAGEHYLQHRDMKGRGKEIHQVELVPGTMLAGLTTNKKEGVNTIHHQAVNTVGEDLIVSAVSTDGLVEAFELKSDKQFLMAVQWHPEHLYDRSAFARAIVKRFVQECRK